MHFGCPGQTAGVILGAHVWPNHPNLNGGKAFCNSAAAIKRYLTDPGGIGLMDKDILDLFDSEHSADEQLHKVGEFLSGWIKRAGGATTTLTDLFLYYVGHGDFIGNSTDFLMLVQASRPRREMTAIPARALASVLLDEAPFVRQVVILDCCWSGAAHRIWQSGTAPEVAAKGTAELMPNNGTVLLCSSSENMPSMAPQGAEHTMFTGALIEALEAGAPMIRGNLSPRQVRDLTFNAMRRRWGVDAVRPVVYAIERGSGDLSDEPLFPNRGAPVRVESASRSPPPLVAAQGGWFELHADTTAPPLTSEHQLAVPVDATTEQARREVVGKRASWRFLVEGRYVPRPVLIARAVEQIESWRTTGASGSNAIPVFWIDGRSGDGKSVLLLQVVQELLRRDLQMLAIKLDKPQALAEALRYLEPHALRSIIVVDDLHRSTRDEAFREAIETHLEQGRATVPILACGPTPEMNAFRGEFRQLFDITNLPMPYPSVEDMRCFATWLGAPFDEKSRTSELLVEFLFELSVGQPLETFAINFKGRLQRAGVFGPVEAALAMNSLDLPADMSLVMDDAGRDYINRLAADDQKHFDRTARLSNDRPAIRFSHNRIAWRLWDIWTTNHLSSIAISLRLARSLLRSVQLCNEVIPELGSIAVQLVTRLPQLMAGTGTVTALETLIELARLAEGQPNAEALLINNTLSQQIERNVELGPEWLLKRSELLLRNTGVSPQLRTSLAARFLLAAEAYDENHRQAVERSVKVILFDPSNMDAAAGVLIWIAARPTARARGWIDWVTEWVTKYPTSPHLGLPLAFVLVQTAGRKGSVELALAWLRDTPPTTGHTTVWVQLLATTAGRAEIVEAALAWLRDTPPTTGHTTVWAQLLAATAGREEIVEAALARLHDNTLPTTGHTTVWAQLLASTAGRAEIVEAALAWLRDTPPTTGHASVWVQLLATTAGREEIVEAALAWLRDTPPTTDHTTVWVQLLATTAGRAEIVEAALAWLRDTPPTTAHANIWTQLLAATAGREDIVELALAWLRDTPPTTGHTAVWAQLLAATAGRADIVEAALAWLRANPRSDPNRAFAVKLLALQAAEAPSDPSLPTEMLNLLNSIVHTSQRTEALSAWIRSGGPTGPAVDFILDIKRKTDDGQLRHRPLAPVCNACAENVEIVLSAAAERSAQAKDLCLLISRGTAAVDGSGAALYEQHAFWPAECKSCLWLAIISARDFPIETYVKDLARWLRNKRTPPHEVVIAFADRPEFDKLIAREFVPAFVTAVRARRRTAAKRSNLPVP